MVPVRRQNVRLIATWVVSAIAIIGCQPAQIPVREISIPRREHGYKYFDSQVLRCDEELADFLEGVADQEHWNQKDKFVAALNNATIDFQVESLLLLRNTAGSGSYRVSLDKPVRVGDDIVFRVQWDSPKWLTMDMAYYCFAIVIPANAAENVHILAPRRKDEVLPLRPAP